VSLSFLTSAIYGGELSASSPGTFTSGEKRPQSAGLEFQNKRKILPLPGIKVWSPGPRSDTVQIEISGFVTNM
jgi:hypothetical protein